jgi:hypothetical protein
MKINLLSIYMSIKITVQTKNKKMKTEFSIMRTRTFLFCLIFLFTGWVLPKAQAQSSTEFWFAAPDPSEDWYIPTFFLITNVSNAAADVTMTFYNGGTSVVRTQTIAVGGYWKFDITTAAGAAQVENPRSQAGNVTNYGIHISSTQKITAYYMIASTDSRDIFTLKGQSGLGKEFYVPMQSDNFRTTGTYTGACDQIDIVATKDNTTVTVTPKAIITVNGSASPAGTPITRTLNKGQTLKIMERNINTTPTLAGTHIVASQDIAVTVIEDLVGGDTSGDQIVPVTSVGSTYVVAKGYMTVANNERVYLVATQAGTNISVNGTQVATGLNAGDTYCYVISDNSAVVAVTIQSNHPIYVYQRTGYNEQGASLLPSIYAVNQNIVSFYVTNATQEKIFIVFRTGKESGFTINYNGATSAFNTGAGTLVPNIPEWSVARLDLPSGSINKVVTIANVQSAFLLGYIAANPGAQTMTCYGNFATFGSIFQFPEDTIYKCKGSAYMLDGGYAQDYLWTLPDGSTATTSTLSATIPGKYKLTVNQDVTITTDSVWVLEFADLSGGTVGSNQTICNGAIPAALTSSVAASGGTGTMSYQWQSKTGSNSWANISGATSATYAPGALTATTQYQRISKNDCGSVASNTVTITIASALLPGAVGSNQTICSGETPAAFTSTTAASGGKGTIKYHWQSKVGSGNWTDISGATYATYTPGALTATTQYQRVATDDCGSVASNTVMVTVNALPAAPTANNITACYDGAEHTGSATTTTGNTIVWYSGTTGATTAIAPKRTEVGTTTTYAAARNTSTGCESARTAVTVTINELPIAGTINGDTKVVIGGTIMLTPTTLVGGDIVAATWRSEDMAIATAASNGEVTGVSEGEVKIWYVVENIYGCFADVSHTVKVLPEDRDYADIRLFICPSIGAVNLTKYIDTVGIKSVSWSSSYTILQPDGVLNTDDIHAPATYTFTYTVIAGSSDTTLTRKVYIKTLHPNENPKARNTVSICYERAKTVQINQIFGIEAGGVLSYDPVILPYISETSYGGILFNGKKYYEDSGGSGVKYVTFTYSAPNSCLPEGKIYTLTVALTN